MNISTHNDYKQWDMMLLYVGWTPAVYDTEINQSISESCILGSV